MIDHPHIWLVQTHGLFPSDLWKKTNTASFFVSSIFFFTTMPGEKEERHTKERGIEPAAQVPNEAKHLLFSRSDTYGANNKDSVKECLNLCCTAASASGDYFPTPQELQEFIIGSAEALPILCASDFCER